MEVLLVMIIVVVVAYAAVDYLLKFKKFDDKMHPSKKCCGKHKKHAPMADAKPKIKVKGMKAKVHHKMKKKVKSKPKKKMTMKKLIKK